MDAALLDVAEVRRGILERLAAMAPGSFRSALVAGGINRFVDELAQGVRWLCGWSPRR